MIEEKEEEQHWLDAPDWWKKWKPMRWLSILVILGGIGSMFWGAKVVIMGPAEHPETALYQKTESRLLFLNNIGSYDSVDAVTAQFTQGNYTWAATALHKPESPKYPPRNLDTLVVADYKHLNIPGELTLEFFNDRLYEAAFIPSDPAEYAERLHQSDGQLKRDRQGRVEYVRGSLRLATNVDFAASDVGKAARTKPFVLWQDLRLMRQREQWESAYSAIAVRGK